VTPFAPAFADRVAGHFISSRTGESEMLSGIHTAEPIELKYCEICGGLYFRAASNPSSLCRVCLRRRALEQAFDRCPVPQRGRPLNRDLDDSTGGVQ
jgi:hypothetical protein